MAKKRERNLRKTFYVSLRNFSALRYGTPRIEGRENTTYGRILPDVPDDHVAVVPAAEADEVVAVAGEAQILDADLVRLVAAFLRALLVIPHDHHGLREDAAVVEV